MTIRQPIITVAGHVDHGKTTLLDRIRGSSIAAGEAGLITQKISFTQFSIDKIRKLCPLIEKNKLKLEIPGFLFIDTPGHAAFTNLRKRGGSLADIAILVIDINEGIKPQTAEVISILKENKTPFIIALNKIDRISGWKKQDDELKKSIEMQARHTQDEFNEKLFTLLGSLHSHGFEAEMYFNIPDFSKKLAIVPCSAKTGEGVMEVLLVLCGLSQKFLQKQLVIGKRARGVVLEIKKEKAMNYIEAVLYDGVLKVKDEIAIATFGKPLITKIRAIEEIKETGKFKPVEKVSAAAGIRIQLTEKAEEVLPGMPFVIFSGGKLEDIEKEFKKELGEAIKTEKQGIIAKADSLGSLEALLSLLGQAGINIVKAGIGNINKSDIISARATQDALDKIIVGFNISIDEDVKDYYGVKILTDDVIYKLIENLQKFREEKRKEIEKERLLGIARIAKIQVLPEFVFRNSNPAIFGVRIIVGKIVPNMTLIDEQGKDIGRIKAIQCENKTVECAEKSQEIAISIPGANFERQISDKKFLYSELTKSQVKQIEKNIDLLESEEISLLREISHILEKRR